MKVYAGISLQNSMKDPGNRLKELREHFDLNPQQVTKRAIPIFLSVTIAPLLLIPLLYLTATGNALHTQVVFLVVAIALLAMMTLSKNVVGFLVCIAIFRAKGEPVVKAVQSAFTQFMQHPS